MTRGPSCETHTPIQPELPLDTTGTASYHQTRNDQGRITNVSYIRYLPNGFTGTAEIWKEPNGQVGDVHIGVSPYIDQSIKDAFREQRLKENYFEDGYDEDFLERWEEKQGALMQLPGTYVVATSKYFFAGPLLCDAKQDAIVLAPKSLIVPSDEWTPSEDNRYLYRYTNNDKHRFEFVYGTMEEDQDMLLIWGVDLYSNKYHGLYGKMRSMAESGNLNQETAGQIAQPFFRCEKMTPEAREFAERFE